MPPLGQVDGVQVVRDDADHGGVQPALQHGLQQGRHIPGGGPLPHHQVAAVAQPLQHVLLAVGLVVGRDAGGYAGAHTAAVHLRKMALQGLPLEPGNIQGFHQVGILSHDVGAYALGKPHGVRPGQRPADDLRVEASAAGFQIGGEGDVGGDDEVELQIGGLRLLQHRLDALQTGYHPDLVEVRHNDGGAVGEDPCGKGADGEGGAFRVDVPVDKPGGQVFSAGVDDFRFRTDPILHVSHRGNDAAADGYAAGIDLPGIHVDDLSVFHHQVGGMFALCDR